MRENRQNRNTSIAICRFNERINCQVQGQCNLQPQVRMYYEKDLAQGWMNLYTILIVMLLQVFFLASYFMASICNVELSQNAIIWYSLLLFGCFMEFFNIISHRTDSNIPNSRHIWMSFGGAVLVGDSLVGLSLILSRIEKKLSARGQLDGRIKRDLIMAKIKHRKRTLTCEFRRDKKVYVSVDDGERYRTA